MQHSDFRLIQIKNSEFIVSDLDYKELVKKLKEAVSNSNLVVDVCDHIGFDARGYGELALLLSLLQREGASITIRPTFMDSREQSNREHSPTRICECKNGNRVYKRLANTSSTFVSKIPLSNKITLGEYLFRYMKNTLHANLKNLPNLEIKEAKFIKQWENHSATDHCGCDFLYLPNHKARQYQKALEYLIEKHMQGNDRIIVLPKNPKIAILPPELSLRAESNLWAFSP
jgi:hypothetical protein